METKYDVLFQFCSLFVFVLVPFLPYILFKTYFMSLYIFFFLLMCVFLSVSFFSVVCFYIFSSPSII